MVMGLEVDVAIRIIVTSHWVVVSSIMCHKDVMDGEFAFLILPLG